MTSPIESCNDIRSFDHWTFGDQKILFLRDGLMAQKNHPFLTLGSSEPRDNPKSKLETSWIGFVSFSKRHDLRSTEALVHTANRSNAHREIYWLCAIWSLKRCEMSWWQMDAQLTRCHPVHAKDQPHHMAFNRGRRDQVHAYPPTWMTQDVLQFCCSDQMRKRRSATSSVVHCTALYTQ